MKIDHRALTAALLASTCRMAPTHEGETPPAPLVLPDEVADITTIPERARGLYTEKDGKFVYTDPAGLKSALHSTRQERDDAARRARAAAGFAALGKTPEEIQAIIAAENERETTRLQKEQDWAGLKEQLENNYKTQLNEKEERIKKLATSLEKVTIDNGIMSALGDKEVEGDPLFLSAHMRGRVELKETDNGFETIVKRPDGTPMLGKDNQPATLKDLALEFKGNERFASAFKGLNQSGGGTSGDNNNSGGTPGDKTYKRSTMTAMQKVSYIREHGQDNYNKLPE